MCIVGFTATLLYPSQVGEPRQTVEMKDGWKFPGKEDMTSGVITCAAITGVNLLIMLAWRHPKAWYTLNRQFLRSAGDPKPFSVLGSVFSHQRWIWHLAQNSAALFIIGMPLCDTIGVSNFMGIYLSTGVFSSLTSLSWHVYQRNFIFAAIGSSGALFGLSGALFTLQAE